MLIMTARPANQPSDDSYLQSLTLVPTLLDKSGQNILYKARNIMDLECLSFGYPGDDGVQSLVLACGKHVMELPWKQRCPSSRLRVSRLVFQHFCLLGSHGA